MYMRMRPLRGLIVSESADLRGRVCELLNETGLVEPSMVMQSYPDRMEGGGKIRLTRPEVAILVINRIPTVLEFVKELESAAPGAAIIAISRLEDPRALTELMRVGVRDFVAAPINKNKFHDALRRVVEQHSDYAFESAPDPVIAFWPSRGGSGTSTLACNLSHALARRDGAEVLLADLDVCAGLSRYMFEMTPSCSLAELAALGQMPDQFNWLRCVVTIGNLHVLYGGKQDVCPPFAPQYVRELFRYASSRFSSILVDLPGTLDGYALEVLRSARRILLVTTAEIPAIGLAREKLEYLSGMDLHTRTSVLLTVGPGGAAPSLSELQAYLGAPIDAVFDFSEKKVRHSLSQGSLVDARTALGRQISEFAQELSMLVQV
jgi:pilus assembly protein CpaE